MHIIIRYSIFAVSIIYMVVCLVLGFETSLVPFSIIVLLVANSYMLFLSRHNMMYLFIAFVIFYSNYSITYVNFINYIEREAWTTIISSKVTAISFNVLVFFNCCLLWTIQWHRIKPTSPFSIYVDNSKMNFPIILLLSIALLFIFRFGYTIPSEVGARGETSAMYEYSIILFILYFYYCGNRRKIVYWGLFLVSIFCIQGIVYGGRIESVQLLLCTYFMLFMTKIKRKKVMAIFLVMFLLMSIVGAVRGELVSGNFEIDLILKRIVERGFTLDTSYAAYYCSETFIYTKDVVTDDKVRDLFFSFLKSLVIGGGGGTEASLPVVTKEFFNHDGGGILPFYFYFYLGVIGIVLSGLIVGIFVNGFLKIGEKSSGLAKCLMVLISSTIFRWYLYSPLMLLRGAMFMAIAYYGLFVLHNLTKPSSRKFLKPQV